MKKIMFSLILFTFFAMNSEAHLFRSFHSHFSVSVQTFYDELSPYGDWIYTPDNGYVWRPDFDYPEAFRPYSSDGRWVFTDYGWTWVSDYSWGWATFHYGRWYLDDYMGWLWIPGYEWAPAWVAWGSYNGYWGWAPLGPEYYVGHVYNSYIPSGWWTFVHGQHFCSHNWNHYIYERPVNVTYITNITNVYNNSDQNSSWYYGPRRSDVERHAGTRVPRVDIVNSNTPENKIVSERQVRMYRPAIDKSGRQARPTEYKPIENERRAERFQPKPSGSNDPGKNRVRESRAAKPSYSSTDVSNQRKSQEVVVTERPAREYETGKNETQTHSQKTHKPETVNSGTKENRSTIAQTNPEKSRTSENIKNQNNNKANVDIQPKQEKKVSSVEKQGKKEQRTEPSQNTSAGVKKSSARETPKSGSVVQTDVKTKSKSQPVKQVSSNPEKQNSDNKVKTSEKARDKRN